MMIALDIFLAWLAAALVVGLPAAFIIIRRGVERLPGN